MKLLKRLAIAVVVVVALLAGVVLVVPPLLWGDGVDYSKASSIKDTSEYQSAALLDRAWALPVAQTYKAGLEFQNNGSFCGPTSLVDVEHSLGAPADQKTVLDDTGISTVFGAVLGGLTLDQLADVARMKTGKKVTLVRDIDLAAFRELLKRANDPAARMIINFHRGPLFAKGGGHHSPIAGYLADDDLVFVLDVNAKYKPWLVKSERLFQAMNTVDPTSKKKRGILLIE